MIHCTDLSKVKINLLTHQTNEILNVKSHGKYFLFFRTHTPFNFVLLLRTQQHIIIFNSIIERLSFFLAEEEYIFFFIRRHSSPFEYTLQNPLAQRKRQFYFSLYPMPCILKPSPSLGIVFFLLFAVPLFSSVFYIISQLERKIRCLCVFSYIDLSRTHTHMHHGLRNRMLCVFQCDSE